MLEALKAEGGYFASTEEKIKIQNALWADGHLNSKIVAQTARKLVK